MKNTLIKVLDIGVLVLLASSFVVTAIFACAHEILVSYLDDKK